MFCSGASRRHARRGGATTCPARGRPRPRAAARLAALAFAAVLTIAFAALLAPHVAAAAARTHDPLYVPTDRAVKLRLIKRLPQAPQILILGGSRASRFEPSYFEGLTGLRGFNLALQNGRPEDAWAFVNFVHQRFPGAPLRVVWFVHVEAFRKQGLSPGIVQDKSLSRWFPDSLIASQRKKLPTSAAQVPKGRDLALTRFGADGVTLRNRYDIAEADGRTLSRAIDYSIRTAKTRYATSTPTLHSRSQLYFEQTVALLNEMGTTQAVVLMPLHPRLLAAVRPAGWQKRHDAVISYLTGLQERYGFGLLDCSELSSFAGDRRQFYDGFHIKRPNARALAAYVVAQMPTVFAPPAAAQP